MGNKPWYSKPGFSVQVVVYRRVKCWYVFSPGMCNLCYFQGPPEYGRSCDYCEQVTMIAYYSYIIAYDSLLYSIIACYS